MTDRKPHLRVGFSVHHRSTHAMQENNPDRMCSLFSAFLHMPSMQMHPMISGAFLVQRRHCMFFILILTTSLVQDFVDDGQKTSPSGEVFCSLLFCTCHPQEHTWIRCSLFSTLYHQ